MKQGLSSDNCASSSPESGRGGPALAITYVFSAPRGGRVLRRGLGVTVISGDTLWWSDSKRTWLTHEEARSDGWGVSSHGPARSFKAFQRHLRRHAAELAGREVVFVSRFEDQDVTAFIGVKLPETATAAPVDSQSPSSAQPNGPNQNHSPTLKGARDK